MGHITCQTKRDNSYHRDTMQNTFYNMYNSHPMLNASTLCQPKRVIITLCPKWKGIFLSLRFYHAKRDVFN